MLPVNTHYIICYIFVIFYGKIYKISILIPSVLPIQLDKVGKTQPRLVISVTNFNFIYPIIAAHISSRSNVLVFLMYNVA